MRWMLRSLGVWLLRRFGVDPTTPIDWDGLDAAIEQAAREMGL